MRGLFVAGTDTGVGKTFVASAICLALRRLGAPVVGLKPFETGCDPEAQDAAVLEEAARSGLPLELRCPFRYRLPLAPAVASRRLGERGPTLRAVAALVRRAAGERFAIVESAGGLLVPISGRRTNLDLAAELRLPVILVGRNGLGTLNHTCLSVAALRTRRLPIAGIVVSRGALPPDPSQADNARWIRELTGIANVIELPRTGRPRAAALLRERLDLDRRAG